jgi:hypothetical protein
MKILADLFSVLPMRVLRALFVGIVRFQLVHWSELADEVRILLWTEMRFRECLAEELANEPGANWAPIVGQA